jgi:hypothetical protein
MTRAIILTLGFSLIAAQGWSQTSPARQRLKPDHLNGMPEVPQVLNAIRGKDTGDTAIRQIAAFSQLREMIEKTSNGRVYSNELTADEQQLMTAYAKAKRDIKTAVEPAPGRERTAWMGKLSLLESSKDFRSELFEKLFAEDWANWYLETTGAADLARAKKIDQLYGEGFSSVPLTFGQRDRDVWIVQVVFAGFLLAITFLRETRRFGFDPREPEIVRAGFRHFRIRTATGTLSNVQEHTYRTRTARWEGDKLVSVNEFTETSQTGTLTTLEKPAMSYNFAGPVAMSDGDLSSIAWLARRGSKSGRTCFLMNHSQQSMIDREGAYAALRPWGWPGLVLAWALFALTRLATPDGSLMLPFCVAVVSWVGYMVIRKQKSDRRIRACRESIWPHMKARLSREAFDLFGGSVKSASPISRAP